MTGQDKKILQEAATIISRELSYGKEVGIPGFGKFYLSPLTVPKRGILLNETDASQNVRIDTVKFRSWGRLKNLLRNPRSIVSPKMSIMAATVKRFKDKKASSEVKYL